MLHKLNEQLEKNNLIVKKGIIVDASVTDTNRKPRGKKNFEITESGAKDNQVKKNDVAVKIPSNVDIEGAWLIKGNKIHYGYKKHVACDEEGLIVAIHTTPANESDTKNLEIVIEKSNLSPQATVSADKAYYSEENKNMLQKKKLKSRIMHKAIKGKPLSKRSLQYNKKISKTRYVIERSFGSMKILSGAGLARYVGKIKTHAQHLLESIAYNLYRVPNLIIKKALQNNSYKKHTCCNNT